MTALVNEDFNRANSGTLGANWTDIGGHASAWTVSSNVATPNELNGFDAESKYTGITWPNDHYAKGVVTSTGTSVSSGDGTGVSVRCGTTGNLYRLIASHAASNNWEIAKKVGGSYTALATTTHSWSDSDTIELDIVGTTLTAKHNGTTVNSTTDSSLSSGSAGIEYSSDPGISATTLDNWEGGDFAGSAPSTTFMTAGMMGGDGAMAR